MVLFMAIFMFGPVVAITGCLIAWKAWRLRRPKLLLILIPILGGEAVWLWAGYRQVTYVTLGPEDERAVPGACVLEGHEARDEVVLSPDGTLSRTATYRGLTQHQTGRWRVLSLAPQAPAVPYLSIDFTGLEPTCLRSTASPGARLHWREPDKVLCQPGEDGGVDGELCRVRGRLALCLGDEGLEYQKQ